MPVDQVIQLAAPTREQDAAGSQDQVWWKFAALPVHARLARIWLAGWLEDQRPGNPDLALCAAVAFSDIVAGAVARGAGPVSVRARLADGMFVCEVSDPGADPSAPPDTGCRDTRRQALKLAAALTANLTVNPAPDGGTLVSFSVELADTGAASGAVPRAGGAPVR